MIFVTEEMGVLVKTPMMLVGAVCASDGMGFITYCREMAAADSFIRAAHNEYNPLVQRVLEKMREAEDRNETLDDFTHVSCEEIEEHLEMIYDLLADHPDGAGYMQFLYDLSEHVARAAGPGFLGIGRKVTAEESAFLATIKEKLRL
jgi:hypothetical protein